MKVSKALYSGAGMAIVAGLLMGAAMRPNLGSDDRPIGPQLFVGWSGVRSTGPFDSGDLAFAAYSASIPDYVVGADWSRLTRPVSYAADPDPAPEPEQYADAGDQTPTFDRMVWEEPPREQTSYPSVDGGRSYDAPPAPQAQRAETGQARSASDRAPADADIGAEAPPEATGDTTIN